MTNEQIEKLHKAIDLAKGRNAYLVDGEPACVIAQLFILQGGSVEELRSWKHVVDKLTRHFPDYHPILLRALQRTWDGYIYPNDEEERRLAMHKIVNYWGSVTKQLEGLPDVYL